MGAELCLALAGFKAGKSMTEVEPKRQPASQTDKQTHTLTNNLSK